MSFLQYMVGQFYENQMLQAAVVAAPLTALTYMAREVPGKIFALIKRTVSTEVQFNSDIADYHLIQALVAKEIASPKWSRKFLYHADEDYDWDTDERSVNHVGLSVGYGTHFGRFGRVPVWIERTMTEGGGAATEKFKETLRVRFLTRRRSVIDRFTKMVEEKAGKLVDQPTVDLYINSGCWWSKGSKLPQRSISTVFTSGNAGQELVDSILQFDADRDLYLQRGMPHRMGALLFGPPGTGKSSLLHAVASETRRSIYYLNLGSVKEDMELTRLVSGSRNWKRALLVIEDFDATGAQTTREPTTQPTETGPNAQPPKPPLTLSALLNVLDGVISPDGLVVIATTNHPEKLDPALIREGRFDIRLELGPLGWEEFVGMADLFGHDVTDNAFLRRVYEPMTGSKLRSLLQKGGVKAVEDHFAQMVPVAA